MSDSTTHRSGCSTIRTVTPTSGRATSLDRSAIRRSGRRRARPCGLASPPSRRPVVRWVSHSWSHSCWWARWRSSGAVPTRRAALEAFAAPPADVATGVRTVASRDLGGDVTLGPGDVPLLTSTRCPVERLPAAVDPLWNVELPMARQIVSPVTVGDGLGRRRRRPRRRDGRRARVGRRRRPEPRPTVRSGGGRRCNRRPVATRSSVSSTAR